LHCAKCQPDETGNDVSELECCFPFAQAVSSEDLAGFDSDLAETGDEELASDDYCSDPGGAYAFCCQKNEGGGNEDFISEWVEQFAEWGDKVHFPREPSVNKVARSSNNEQNERGSIAPCGKVAEKAYKCHREQ